MQEMWYRQEGCWRRGIKERREGGEERKDAGQDRCRMKEGSRKGGRGMQERRDKERRDAR